MAAFPFSGSFWINVIFPFVIHIGTPPTTAQVWRCSVNIECNDENFLNQYPWTMSEPGAFQLVIFLVVVFTFSTLILTSSWLSISLNLSLYLGEPWSSFVKIFRYQPNIIPKFRNFLSIRGFIWNVTTTIRSMVKLFLVFFGKKIFLMAM